MTTLRRRILRPHQDEAMVDSRQHTRLQRNRDELGKSRISLKRWLTRLKRAVHTVADLHQRITKLEALLA